MFGKLLEFRLSLLVTFPFLSVSCAVSSSKSEYGAYILFAVSYSECISLELGKISMPFSWCLCQALLYVGAESLYPFPCYLSEPEVSEAEVA